MAYYGIPSAGIALTAGSDNDQIGVIGHGATTLTAQTIFGGEGNDIINFGAAGFTASPTATISGNNTVSGGGLTGNDQRSHTASLVARASQRLSPPLVVTRRVQGPHWC